MGMDLGSREAWISPRARLFRQVAALAAAALLGALPAAAGVPDLRSLQAEPDPSGPGSTPSQPATPTPAPAPPDTTPKPSGVPPASSTPTPEEVAADQKLAERLAPRGANPSVQTDLLLTVAWDSKETAETRTAALRRLSEMDPRVIAEEAIPLLGTAPAASQIGLLDLISTLYTKLGGVYSSLNVAMSDQIRSLDPAVAHKAIETCTQLGVREAYLPLREIASRPGAPMRDEAINGLAKLSDPRAVPFFKSLLDANSVSRDEIYQALGTLGRPSALLLKSKLDDPDAAERRRALDALLPMATVDDLGGLYAYIQKYPPDGDLKKRIYDVIATIESQSFERPLGTGD